MDEERTPLTPVGACPGCGLLVDDSTPVDAPGGAAVEGCRRLFGEALAFSYGRPERRAVHQLLVDAWVAQHGGGDAPRQARAVALCLMTLCLVIERGADPEDGPALHRRMATSGVVFDPLPPPPPSGAWSGDATVQDVVDAPDPLYPDAVRGWADAVWESWRPRHPIVHDWLQATLVD